MAVLCDVQYSPLLIEMDLISIIFLLAPILVLNASLSTSLYFGLGKIGRNRKDGQGKCNERRRPEKGGIREDEFEFLYVTI